jgi:hypothetical protein
MTQLNLSGRQSNDSQQKPAAEPEEGSIKNQTVGALGALAMFAAVIVIGSCSRSSKPVAVQQPTQTTTPAAAPASTVQAPAPPPAAVVAKAKKHRAATLSYINREYGLSFNFPRNYQLKTQIETQADATKKGNETQATSATNEPLPMNFAHSGGVELAAVEMPANSYPGTDFQSGLLDVSVNPGMTSEACSQFALTEANGGADPSSPAKIVPVKIGTLEFQQVESPSDAMMKTVDTKYYHVFGNGGCYEFGLGITTNDAGNGDGGEITPVDRQAVFARLERILATVRLRPAVMPETHAPVPAVAATTPADSSDAAQHEVAAPNF